jgi:hypothetical protein
MWAARSTACECFSAQTDRKRWEHYPLLFWQPPEFFTFMPPTTSGFCKS